MIGSLNHIAIAVPNLVEAMAKYSGPLGAKVGIPQDLVEHGVDCINDAISKLTKDGATILGDGLPKIGAHGNPVIFLHPKDFNGTLIELEEVKG